PAAERDRSQRPVVQFNELVADAVGSTDAELADDDFARYRRRLGRRLEIEHGRVLTREADREFVDKAAPAPSSGKVAADMDFTDGRVRRNCAERRWWRIPFGLLDGEVAQHDVVPPNANLDDGTVLVPFQEETSRVAVWIKPERDVGTERAIG